MPIAPVLAWVNNVFSDDDNLPLAGGKVYFFEAGTTTPLPTYSEANLDPLSERTHPVILGADGRPSVGENIYVLPRMYKVVVHDANDVEIITRDDVGDRGFINTVYAGVQQTEGGDTAHTGTYDMVESDRLIAMDTSGGAGTVNLLAASAVTQPIVIKNMGTNTVAVTPNGSDTIDGIAAAYSMAAGASPVFPALMLISNGVDAWTIIGSHGL
jgi:hypothetical protein